MNKEIINGKDQLFRIKREIINPLKYYVNACGHMLFDERVMYRTFCEIGSYKNSKVHLKKTELFNLQLT